MQSGTLLIMKNQHLGGCSKPVSEGGNGLRTNGTWVGCYRHTFLFEKRSIHRQYHHNEITFRRLRPFPGNFVLNSFTMKLFMERVLSIIKCPVMNGKTSTMPTCICNDGCPIWKEKMIFMGMRLVRWPNGIMMLNVNGICWTSRTSARKLAMLILMDSTYKKKHFTMIHTLEQSTVRWMIVKIPVIGFVRQMERKRVLAVFRFTPNSHQGLHDWCTNSRSVGRGFQYR